MIASKPTQGLARHTSEETLANAAFSWGPPATAPPWAWSGLAPIAQLMAQAALAGIGTAESALTLWRRSLDASRTALRAQQDSLLDAWSTQLEQIAGASTEAESASAAPGLLSPILAAAKAYEQFGAAVLEAQRGALDALSNAQRIH